ncbi:MFS transporter [Streptomonospora sp. S1-112]|uniref:MFS transporter n=1 Tax=Streptomonospora mangrovi TaxID=2883123 RepID=A0A9X3SCA7_9ACTN|nr:MFS transporter [Streptomonospora mangrovi]MDA0563443.1 MFS transporter [Streptomonospora mangrovi]
MSRLFFLPLLCLVQVLLMIDAIVVTALPAIAADLRVDEANLPWVGAAYLVAFGGFLVVGGRTGDLFGHRITLIAGLSLFTAASLLCGLADTPALLFAGRAAQGLGAAFASPAAFAMVTTRYPEGLARNRALSIWSAVGTAGTLAGSALGGVVADLAGWRWVFLINVPAAIVLLVAVVWLLPRDPARAPGRIDIGGALLLTCGAVSIVTAAVTAEDGVDLTVMLFAVAGAGLIAAFVVVERRVRQPIVRLGLLANPYVRVANLFTVLGVPTVHAVNWFSSFYMQNELGMSATQAGLGLIPASAVIVLLSTRSGAMAAKVGVRTMFLAAAAATACSLAALMFITEGGSYWTHVLPGVVLMGVSGGLSYAPSLIAATTGVPRDEQGLAGGMQNTSSQLGGAIGLALLNTVAVAAGGYGAAFMWALVLPALMAVCALTLPRRDTFPAAPGTLPAEHAAHR